MRTKQTSIDRRLAIVQGKSVIEKARQIKATLGTFTAARYLAKRDWSIESALFILVGNDYENSCQMH